MTPRDLPRTAFGVFTGEYPADLWHDDLPAVAFVPHALYADVTGSVFPLNMAEDIIEAAYLPVGRTSPAS